MSNPNQKSPNPNGLSEVLGYLNFSNGAADSHFASNLNQLFLEGGEPCSWQQVRTNLEDELTALQETSSAFAEITQAKAVLQIAFEDFLPAYRKFHQDLFFHLDDGIFQQPFFLVCIIQSLLKQGGPWNEHDRILNAAINDLNDFIGYRPVALLENDRKMQPYRHEWHRPLPIYFKEAGAAVGPYHDLIQSSIQFFSTVPEQILEGSYFQLDRLQELAIDLRAHDHLHPVNKRTNYTFGEWDPNLIDTKGFYSRFVIRKIILETLQYWIDTAAEEIGYEEALHDASAVLCGTMLMATSISGSGPDTHDSSISLTSLMPLVARQRDAYYKEIMNQCEGERKRRLTEIQELTQQPFGHVRQFINLSLSRYGSAQTQHRHLSHFFARLGMDEASERNANATPAVSGRFESHLQILLTRANLLLDQQDFTGAQTCLKKVEELIKRGIRCGALIDPWNILAFQGQFPLFQSREDSLPDHRVDIITDLMEQLFTLYTRAMSEVSAIGNEKLRNDFSTAFEQSAANWDRYATTTVNDVMAVEGETSCKSAQQVSDVLQRWRAAGESKGDIAFWREQVEHFESARSYAIVVEQLLKNKDLIAAAGLLMQWLGQSEEVGIEAPPHSFHSMLLRLLNLILEDGNDSQAEKWKQVIRLFRFLEANAGEFWNVPDLSSLTDFPEIELDEDFEDSFNGLDEDDEPDEEDELFSAAYDGVVYRDSADDGVYNDTLDEGYGRENTEFEIIATEMEPRLRFLMVLVRMWQIVSVQAASDLEQELQEPDDPVRKELQENIRSWYQQTQVLRRDLVRLLLGLTDYDIATILGDQEANIEFDIELQSKSYLQYMLTETHLETRRAEWLLLSCLPEEEVPPKSAKYEQKLISMCQAMYRRDLDSVRELIPELLKDLNRFPLLYVPYDAGGEPDQLRAARTLQTILRFLLTQLPRLGLLRETYHVLAYALYRERPTSHSGTVITEFDHLFRIALEGILKCVICSTQSWDQDISESDKRQQLNNFLNMVVQQFGKLWLKQSRKMRLSAAEILYYQPPMWEGVRTFIEEYGSELFHPSQLALGSIRTISNQQIEPFLDYLEEMHDPLEPMKLIEDLQSEKLHREDAIKALEIIYTILIDKYDRFMDYNATTTQSDYGEMLHVLFSFLILESQYDRDAWNLMPERIAHRVLTDMQLYEDAQKWEDQLQDATAEKAAHYLDALQQLEQTYAIKLLAIDERLNQRFIKPLAVNRMLARIPQALVEGLDEHQPGPDCRALEEEIETYLEETQGASADLPAWLTKLEHELEKSMLAREADIVDPTEMICVPQEILTHGELSDLFSQDWEPRKEDESEKDFPEEESE